MKAFKTSLIIGLMVATNQSFGSLILLSETRSVSVQGSASGTDGIGLASYSALATPSTPFGNFSAALSGTATYNNNEPRPEGVYPGFWWSTYQSSSSASQSSSFTANSINASGHLYANSQLSGASPAPGPSASSSAYAIFQIMFQVTEPTEVALDFSISKYRHDYPGADVQFSFLSLANGNMIGSVMFDHQYSRQYSTTLAGDIYTISFSANLQPVADPLGDFQSVDYDLALNVFQTAEAAAIPDFGFTASLLGSTMIGFCMLKKRFGKAV